VDVRVLVDGVGELYSLFPRASKLLHRHGVRAERFLPPRLLPPSFHLNLRNHRKILVVDGQFGFTGGMNILEDYLHSVNPKRPKCDLHFEVRGPIVSAIQEVFADDWAFATGEELQGEAWFPALEPSGRK
jgi:cardiolipin synthase A/B